MKYFQQLDSNVDVELLKQQLELNQQLWNQHDLRTTYPESAHKEAHDIWLRFNDFSGYTQIEEYYKAFDDVECIDYPALFELPAAIPLIFNLMHRVQGRRLGRVIITMIEPGKRIYPHIDEGAYADYYDRFHIILQNGEGSIFKCGNEEVNMKVGDVYWFDTSAQHEVINNSLEERLSLIVDIRY